MELIYIWINKTEIDNYLENEGICFNSKYIVNFSYSGKMLSVKSQQSQIINLFKNDTITNVTAIVGKNGAGKTTLLNYIFDNNVRPLSEEERDEYSSYFDNYDNKKKHCRYSNIMMEFYVLFIISILTYVVIIV